MSFLERDDNASQRSSPESTQPRLPLLSRSDKPLFVSRNNKTSGGLFGRSAKDGEEWTSKPRSGGWMGGRGPQLGLGEAFQRTDANGNFLPRQRPSPREGAVGAISDSRIPRTKTFSPPQMRSSPPTSFDGGYGLEGRQGRASSMPLDSESDTGTRDGSPSPAVRNRRRPSREWSGSDASQLSLVEDPTIDNFDNKMSQFAKDQARRKNLLASQKSIFLKGQVGPRVAETTKTLARKASDSSLEAEPPIRPPRTWGSKARRNDSWMQKILSPDTSLELKDEHEDQAPLERQRAEADVPLPSVEDKSSIQALTPPASRPASAQPNNGSPEKSQVWNADLDFTAHSLTINTSPQLRMRPTKLDEIRDREIQTLTARAVATNRLEEIRERNSEDRSIAPSPVQVDSKGLPSKENEEPEPQVEETFHEMTILEEEGEHIRGTPITIFSRAAYENRSRSNSSSRERGLNPDGERSTGRSTHSRDHSRELLRRLSRSVSHSPVPAKPVEKEAKMTEPPSDERPEKKEEKTTKAETAEIKPERPTEKVEERTAKPEPTIAKSEKLADKRSGSSSRSSVLDTGLKRYSAASTPPKSDVDPEERITAEARLFDLQDNKSEKNSVKAPSRSPSPAPDDGQFDETPRPKPRVDPLSLPTPKVTGAYIETPAPTARKPRKERSISPYYEVVNAPANEGSSSDSKQTQEATTETSTSLLKDRPRRQLRRTSSHRELATEDRTTKLRPLINTATPASVADDLRHIQQEAQLEDSVLDDFDALLEADAAATADLQNNTTILEPVLDLEYDERGLPLSKKAIERRIEKLQLDRMSQSIKNTSSSIRDARQGIERLEERVSSSLPSVEKSDDTLYINLRVPVPKLWVSQPPPKPGMKSSWKFTFLGLILTVFFGWYIAESAMCSQFCHPTQSTVNTWQPSDPFFPWAIPTKLDQWTGKVISTTASDVWDVIGWKKSKRRRYQGGPMGASDWWQGRSGPAGLQFDDDWMSGIGGDPAIDAS